MTDHIDSLQERERGQEELIKGLHKQVLTSGEPSSEMLDKIYDATYPLVGDGFQDAGQAVLCLAAKCELALKRVEELENILGHVARYTKPWVDSAAKEDV